MGVYANSMIGFGTQAPMSGYPQTPTTEPASLTGGAAVRIDGTPTRVATIAFLCVGGLLAFKLSGVRFSIAN